MRSGVSWKAFLVKINHIGEGTEVGAVDEAHLDFGGFKRFAAHFALAHLDDLAVPLGGADVGGEEGAEAVGEVGFIVGGADRGDDVVGFDAEVEAEEAVEAFGEIALVGLGEGAGEVVADFGEEAREVKQAEDGVREIGRGEVEEDLAGVVARRLGGRAG